MKRDFGQFSAAQHDISNITVAPEKERWMIIVTVGLDGTEVRVAMDPEEKIALLLSRVTALCGKRGTLFNDIGKLRLADTASASGLSDQAAAHLQIEDLFSTEQAVMISVRDHFKVQTRGWASLEKFTEPNQFAGCVGVQVNADGRVVQLDLSCSEIIGETVWLHH